MTPLYDRHSRLSTEKSDSDFKLVANKRTDVNSGVIFGLEAAFIEVELRCKFSDASSNGVHHDGDGVSGVYLV